MPEQKEHCGLLVKASSNGRAWRWWRSGKIRQTATLQYIEDHSTSLEQLGILVDGHCNGLIGKCIVEDGRKIAGMNVQDEGVQMNEKLDDYYLYKIK